VALTGVFAIESLLIDYFPLISITEDDDDDDDDGKVLFSYGHRRSESIILPYHQEKFLHHS
jgi:hypothetical protein